MAIRSGLNLGRRPAGAPDRAMYPTNGGVGGAMGTQGSMLASPPMPGAPAAAPPVVSRGNIANDPRGLRAYQQQMNSYGSRTGGLSLPRFGYGVGPNGQGWSARDIEAGAGMPQQSVDGQYAVNPQGKYAMGGQYFLPGTTMAPVQGWRQGVAPSAADMAVNDAFQGKKQQYVNNVFKDKDAAYARMAQARARRMGIPIAGLDAAGVQQAIARGQDMRALRARGVNTNDPRVMRQFATPGTPTGNPYAMQRLGNIMSSDTPNINQAIEAAVDAGLPPDQIRQQIGGMFGTAAFEAAMQDYSNYGGGFFGGENSAKKRIHQYFNPAATALPNVPPGSQYIQPPQLPPSIRPVVPPPPRPNPPPPVYNPANEGVNSSGDVWGAQAAPARPSTPPRTGTRRGWTFGPFGFQYRQ